MRQLELFENTVTGKLTGKISEMEFGILKDKCSKPVKYVYGTYEEVEAYAEKEELWVDQYLDHVNPSTVQKNFLYVGQGTAPYELQRGFNYETHKKVIDNSF